MSSNLAVLALMDFFESDPKAWLSLLGFKDIKSAEVVSTSAPTTVSDRMAERARRYEQMLEDSSTYQWIVRQGELKGARRILLLMGDKKFGPPTEASRAAVEGNKDLEALMNLGVHLLSVNSWEELLADQP